MVKVKWNWDKNTRLRRYLKISHPNVYQQCIEHEERYQERKKKTDERHRVIMSKKLPKEVLEEFHKETRERIERLNNDGWMNVHKDNLNKLDEKKNEWKWRWISDGND